MLRVAILTISISSWQLFRMSPAVSASLRSSSSSPCCSDCFPPQEVWLWSPRPPSLPATNMPSEFSQIFNPLTIFATGARATIARKQAAHSMQMRSSFMATRISEALGESMTIGSNGVQHALHHIRTFAYFSHCISHR